MKVVTGQIMRAIDKAAIENYNIPGIILMENAALSVVDVIAEYSKTIKHAKVTIVAGKGNNGGDGFCIARHLYKRGMEVNIIFVGDITNVIGDALTNYKIISAIGIAINIINSDAKLELARNLIRACDITVDALLGTGLKGGTDGLIKDMIDTINEYSRYVIAVDGPSGVNAETGHVETNAVKADKTVTFALIKQGLLLYPGKEYVGELICKDIGIPDQIIKSMNIKTNIVTKQECIELMPRRLPRSNKGTYGKLMVIAGSNEMTGAPILTCKAAYKTGVGLVNLVSTNEAITIAQAHSIENVYTIAPSKEGKLCLESFEVIKDKINKATAIALGPGLGQGLEVTSLIEKLLNNINVPIVIDADGLNAIQYNVDILKAVKAPVIITPHPMEMSRLTGLSVEHILAHTIEVATDFSKKYNLITLLKDARTIIADPNGDVYINTTGNSSMAKAGSGDVLTGIIGALLAQHVEPFIAAALGAYLHGRAGELASQKLGVLGVLASDLCDYIAKDKEFVQ
jgi:NAD(P)H-hydrate epimerase